MKETPLTSNKHILYGIPSIGLLGYRDDTIDEAREKQNNLLEILKVGGFPLRK